MYLDSAALPSVGVGHLIRLADNLKPGDTITPERADEFLQHDLELAAACVDRACPNLTANQRDALISFVFNIGCGAFHGSHLRYCLDAGDISGAAQQFQRWDRAGNTHPAGLKVRRALERDLFLAPDGPMPDGWLTSHDHEFV